MKCLILFISLVTQFLATAGLNVKEKENTGDSFLHPVPMDIMEQGLRLAAVSGRSDDGVQCNGCNYWKKLKLTGKLLLYFAQCKRSNSGDKEKTFLCLLDKLYGPNSKISAECKPCICDVICSRKPSFCARCQCGQDVLIPAPSVVPCLTNTGLDPANRTLCALRNYMIQADTNSLPVSCSETSKFFSCDSLCDVLKSNHIDMTDLLPTECLLREKCKTQN